MTKVIHYGIIGCGMMGQEHLRNIALLKDTNVKAIYEPDIEMAKKAYALAPNAIFTHTINDLLSIDDIDCLLIVSPNFCHIDQLMQILDKRHIPILIEKPLFTNENDVAKLKKFRDAYKSHVWVAMEYRYMPPIQALSEKILQSTGKINMLTIKEHRFPFLEKVNDWNRFNKYSGGTLVEKCCHFFDLMRLLIKSEPIRIMASPGRFWPEHLGPAPTPKLIISPRKPQGPIHEDIFVDEELLNAGDHNGSTFFQHQKFLELVRGNLQLPEVSLLDGWKAVAMGLAAQKSAETGLSVDLLDINNYPT